MKQWYEKLFEDYGKNYDKEGFTQGTVGECDFIESEINYNKHLRILDVGCGTGRHAIELTRRGYQVTGIDLSETQLGVAREKAAKAGLKIDFIRCDARDMPFEDEFDLAIMICEGAFPLMETDEMNYAILKSVSKALKPKAKFIFTTLNGLFPIFNSVEAFCNEPGHENVASYHGNNFDIMTFRDHNITSYTNDKGENIELACNERYYIPSEITWLLKSLGFHQIDIYGARLGAFSRGDKLTVQDFEMLVIAELI